MPVGYPSGSYAHSWMHESSLGERSGMDKKNWVTSTCSCCSECRLDEGRQLSQALSPSASARGY